MNAIASRSSNAVGALQNLRSGLQNVQATLPQAGGEPLLKFSKGDWTYGAEQIEIEPGSKWAVNPLSLMHGWVSWDTDSASLEGEVLVPMTDALPAKGGLPNTGFKWDEQLSLQFKCISGEDEGEQVLHKTSSVGGLDAIRGLIKAIMKQLDTDPNSPCPVVLLKRDHYNHKKWGKVFTPVFEIVGWMSLDGAQAEADEQEAEPAKTTEADDAPLAKDDTPVQDDQDSGDAAPRRRRRRS